MKKIIVKNKSKKLSKDDFKSKVNYIYTISSKMQKKIFTSPKIKIFIKDDIKCNGSVCKKHNHYEVLINSNIIVGYDIFLESVIHHEFSHIFDIEHAKPSMKYCKVNSGYTPKLEKCILDIGFFFWTEYYAYLNTFDYYTSKSCTKLQLVNQFKKIISFSKKVDETKEYEELISRIRYFVYNTSAYLAYMKINPKIVKYCQNTTSRKEFNYVSKCLDKLSKKYNTMFHGLYGLRFKKRIYKIGEFIIDNFFVPFNIAPNKYKGKYVLSYMYKEN